MITPYPHVGGRGQGVGGVVHYYIGSIPGVGVAGLCCQVWWAPPSKITQICNSLPLSRRFYSFLVTLYVYGIIEAILGIYERLSFGSGHDTFDIFGNGVNRDRDFLFSEPEHGIEGGSGFNFISWIAFRVAYNSEHGGNYFGFEVVGVNRGGFFHAVNDFLPFLGGGHTRG